MAKNTAVMVAAVVFLVIAVVHLLRLVFGWTVTFETWVAPMWLSVIGLLVAGGMAVWLWKGNL